MQRHAQVYPSKKTSGYDVGRVRADFPILKREINGRPLVYLDNAATSHRSPRQILQPLQRQRLQRSLPNKRRSHSSLRRRPAKNRPPHQRQGPVRDNLRTRNNGSNQPGSPFLGTIKHRPRRRYHAHRDGASQQHCSMATAGA